MTHRLVGADGRRLGEPTPDEKQLQMLAQEAAIGRFAMKILSALLLQQPGRKVAIKKAVFVKIAEKYPGGVIRFGDEAERVTARFAMPDELDAAERPPAETPAAPAEGGDGEASG